MPDPIYNEIDASNLESVRKNTVFNNLFVDTPTQAKLRRDGVWDPFLGGNGMVENFTYGRTQGKAVSPGATVTVTRQQLNTGMKFFPKAYVAWAPLDDWELDEGDGGGVINSGPSRIYDQYQNLLQNMTMTHNTMQEMDLYRHGQASNAGIRDNRILNSNGLDEALNNGIDNSPFGNIYTNYGGNVRNGVIGPALNSTPLYLGTPDGGVGTIDFNALMELWGRCTVTGGKPSLGITNVLGFVGVAKALDAQRRDVSNTKHDIDWTGLNFNGIDIYQSPLAPSAAAGDFLSLAPANGKAGNNNLQDGAGSSTQTKPFQTPQFTLNGAPVDMSPTGSRLPSNKTIQPGEVLYFIDTSGLKIRQTNKKGWSFGLRRSPMPNNVSIDALFMRLGINMYLATPRKCAVAYGFSK